MSTDVPVATSVTPAPAEAPKPKKPGINVYTVMLGIALFAICLACLFLVLELYRYNLEIHPGRPML